MRCRRAQALLPLMLDGVLPLSEERMVQEHLKCCTRCARLMRSIAHPLPPLPPVPPRAVENMHRRLEEALRAQARGAPSIGTARAGAPVRAAPWGGRSLAWLTGVVAGATAAWLLVLLTPANESSPEDAPGVPTGALYSTGESDNLVRLSSDPGRVPIEDSNPVGRTSPRMFVNPATYLMTGGHSAFLGLRRIPLTQAAGPFPARTTPSPIGEMEMPPWLRVSSPDGPPPVR